MGSVQQIKVKWNHHQSNFTKVFESLLHKKEFVDVTLACEGRSVKAHKVVLSACSPYFHTLFLENPCKHPIVLMRDYKYSDIEAIVEYMYKGEVNIPREALREFLKTAQTLQVKGLADDESGETDNESEQTDKRTYPPLQNRVPDPHSEIAPPPITNRPAAISQQRLSNESYSQPPSSPSVSKQYKQPNTQQDTFVPSPKRMRTFDRPLPSQSESAPSPSSYKPNSQTNTAQVTTELTETSIKVEVKPFDTVEYQESLNPQGSQCVEETMDSLVDESQDQCINSPDEPDMIVLEDDPEIIEDEPELMFAHGGNEEGLSQDDSLSGLISALRDSGTVPSTSSPQQFSREDSLGNIKTLRRSRIYEYFLEEDPYNAKVVCRVCGKTITRGCKMYRGNCNTISFSTSHLISHLRSCSPHKFAEFKRFKSK